MLAKQARRRYLWHPLNWPSWLGAAILYPLAFLPYPIQCWLGKQLGKLCFRLMKRRRHIAEVNLKLCFPELTETERQAMLYQSFIELGQMMLDTNLCWWRPVSKLPVEIKVEGLEELLKEHQLGHGVLIVGAHFTTLELAGAMMAELMPLTVTMRRLKNPVFDTLFKRARQRNYKALLDRTEIRGMLRTLNHNGILWYAPDQDYGLDNSVFVPFFGQEAATLKITPKLLQKTKAKVFFGSHYRVSDKQIVVQLESLNDSLPTEDLKQDVQTINQFLEQKIKAYPAQYLWIHRRFKTTANGEKSMLYKQPLEEDRSPC